MQISIRSWVLLEATTVIWSRKLQQCTFIGPDSEDRDERCLPSVPRRNDHAKLVSWKVLGMHPVPKMSRITELHEHEDNILTSGQLTIVLLAAQEIVSDIANQICSLNNGGQLDDVDMCSQRDSVLLDADRHNSLRAERLWQLLLGCSSCVGCFSMLSVF